MIGLILSFCYTDGITLKAREFTKSFAEVHSEKVIGVLGTWYSWNKEGVLQLKKVTKHDFVQIVLYRGTLEQPKYCNKSLTLSKNVLEIINKSGKAC